MKPKPLKILSAFLLCLGVGLLLYACGGGGSGGGVGTLSTSLTDSSTDEYQAIYVTIARVEVHNDAGDTWQTVATPGATYNLLDLVNGVRENLGLATLAAGHYTQMRLIIGLTPGAGLNLFSQPHPYANYLIDKSGAIHELKVPSGPETGLKLVNGFDINADQTTELILDFDALRSVVIAGSSGQYLLKPTIKVLDTAEGAIVSGTVTDAATEPPTPLSGALVTAQTATTAAGIDVKDQVVVAAGTLTDANGGYALFLAPLSYNLVAVEAGYLPACSPVELGAGDTSQVDFSLTAAAAAPGTIAGTVSIAAAVADQHVTIDFRQEIDCGGTSQVVTVKSLNVADGGSYTVELPAGDYQVVASSFGKDSQTADATVVSAATTTLDLAF